jgi:hypothetical protein
MAEYAETALECALEALRDRTAGRYEVDAATSYGVYADQGKVLFRISEDGRAIRTNCENGDLQPPSWAAREYELAAEEHFSSCLALSSPDERYQCLFDGLTNRVELPMCDE